MGEADMKVLFACGGTAGHINPALAIASALKKENPGVVIRFVGNGEKMEARLVPKAGYDFVPLRVEGFQRKLTMENIRRNVQALGCLLRSTKEVRRILGEFRPDVVVGTGGYVSGPVLREAAKQGYHTLTHESNAYPGVTTKLLAKYVDKVLLVAEKAREYLPKSASCVVTGNPVREELFRVNRREAREKLGAGDRVCVLSLGGSLGAARVNESIAELIAYFQGTGELHHIHATGRYGAEGFPDLLKAKGVKTDAPHLDIREYIDDMADCLAAADLVICRSGAITLAELQAVGRASILIPSPNVAENHQYHNAMVLQNRNAAIVIEEKDLTGGILCETVGNLVSDPQELQNMGQNAAAMAITDAGKRICDEITALYQLVLREGIAK
jgi:UDP-N-acetylglucosamine--N-acetylmuramyl-(pentapeptide) pyrophosphoryl-undecaprenol N-acetylglucosamine transferase